MVGFVAAPGSAQGPLQPAHVLGRPVTVPHFRTGPWCMPMNRKPPLSKAKRSAPQSRVELRAARFGPLRVVVAGDEVIGDAQTVEDVLGHAEIREQAHFGDVAGHQDEGETGLRIDIRDRGPEVVRAPVGADVRIAQPGEAQGGPAGRRAGRRPRARRRPRAEGRAGYRGCAGGASSWGPCLSQSTDTGSFQS